MKKIIKGKLYDTATAKFVGDWDNNQCLSIIDYVHEALYLKKTGEFFVHGEGGARTKYARSTSGGWGSGEEIVPLTYDEARQWAEEHLDPDRYLELFGAVEEDDTRTALTLSLAASSIDRAKRAAAQRGLTLSAYIDELISTAQNAR